MHIDAEVEWWLPEPGGGEWANVGQEHEVSVIPDDWALGI